MRRATLAALLALTATGAQAARPACVQPDDMRTLLRIALPDAIEGLTERCKAVLPGDAFLPSQGMALANRFRHEAPIDPTRARAAISAATGQDLSNFADDSTVLTIAHGFIENAIQDRVATRDCSTIDGLVALAAPLHGGAMADALLLVLQLAGPGQIKGLAICGPSDESAPQ